MHREGILRAALALALVAAILGAGAWMARHDPIIAFLAAEGPARWILYPRPADLRAHPLVEVDTAFRRVFALSAPPHGARLRLRAFRRAEVRLNGEPVPLSGAASWKEERGAEVGRLLRAGENDLEVRVANDAGPPALWLALVAPGVALVSDGAWEASAAGATWRPAALVEEPPAGRRYDPERTIPAPAEALGRRWLATLLLGLGGGAAVWMASRASGRLVTGSPWPLRLALLGACGAWVALVVRASPSVPIQLGFDAPQHLEYVDHILKRHALPLADEGWQMFQPPLYYLLAAGALALAGMDTGAAGAATVLRGLGLAIGLANLALVAAVLRRLLPARPAAHVAGLLTGALLPVALTLHLFPTNEILVAVLCSAALLAALRLLEAPTARGHAMLGLLLGLALLAKFSAVLLLPPVAAALGVRAWRSAGPERQRRLGHLAIAGAAALVACGWHYGRVWARFGTPLVGGWEARPGLGWWLDPGYRTAGHFLRFGRALVDPVFAGLGSFWDGIYSTLWADGMLSGLASSSPLPPWWSPGPHSAGLLLALVPTAVVLTGLGASALAWLRRPDAAGGLLLGLAATTLAAQLLMSLRVPAVAQDKASYGLLALAALCLFAGRGLELLAGGSAWRRAVLVGALAAWAGNGVATFWLDVDGPGPRRVRAMALRGSGLDAEADAELAAGMREHPEDWGLRLALARALMQRGAPPAALDPVLLPRHPEPDLPARNVALAYLAEARGDLPAALGLTDRALRRDPDHREAWELKATLLEGAASPEEAVACWREVLRLDPLDAQAHAALARLLAGAGRAEEAAALQAWSQRAGRR